MSPLRPAARLRPVGGSPGARILGLGAYEPSRVVDNAEMCTMIDSSDEWIRQRTGIAERRWATPEETLTMMSVRAARQALDHAGLTPADIDAVLVATVTHFQQWPSLACLITAELGRPELPAWDISAACAGFCYALGQADALVRAGASRHVLVVTADRLSDMTDVTDRTTAFLFADGAGAAVVGPSDTPGIGPTVWGGDSAQADAITQTLTWPEGVAQGVLPKAAMEGKKVFRWAMTDVADMTRHVIEASGLTPDQIDLFVPHQANDRITDAMLRHLKLPDSVIVARNIQRTGNTSASSIPLAIARLYADDLVSPGATCLMVGFGAGLVYAGQVALLP